MRLEQHSLILIDLEEDSMEKHVGRLVSQGRAPSAKGPRQRILEVHCQSRKIAIY